MGTTTPDASSMLEITSTTKGFLMPRMTTVQRTAIATPATGLQVYDTDTNSPWYYNGTVWVNAATAGQKWVDGATAGDIELVNPTGKDFVKYTDSGLKILDKLSTSIYELYDASSNTFSNHTQGIFADNSYNHFVGKTSSIVETLPGNSWSSMYNFISRIDNTDNRINKTILGISNQVQILSNNSNNHSSIRAVFSNVTANGTGTISNLIGNYTSLNLNKDQGANIATVFSGFSAMNSSKNIGTLSGILSSNTIGRYQTGVITNLIGVSAVNTTNALSTTNITSLRSFETQVNLNATWTGTLTNYYDFYAPSVGNGGGTVSNKYGVFILGSDKTNYFQGNLGIGTTTPTEKLEVNGAIKIGSTSAAAPTAGTIRFNTTTSKFEGYDGTAWVAFH